MQVETVRDQFRREREREVRNSGRAAVTDGESIALEGKTVGDQFTSVQAVRDLKEGHCNDRWGQHRGLVDQYE